MWGDMRLLENPTNMVEYYVVYAAPYLLSLRFQIPEHDFVSPLCLKAPMEKTRAVEHNSLSCGSRGIVYQYNPTSPIMPYIYLLSQSSSRSLFDSSFGYPSMQYWKTVRKVCAVSVCQRFPAYLLEHHRPHGDEVDSGPQRSLTKCFWSYIEMVLSSSMMPCLCRCVKPYGMKWTFCWSMDKCGIANPIHMRRALCIMTFGWLGIFEAVCCILAGFYQWQKWQ